MKHILQVFIILFLVLELSAQSNYQMKGNDDKIDINFLTSYYQQDGQNSAVQGGVGSEELIDVANIIIVNIPKDSIKSFNIMVGADFYSSASTDQIDANVSSASIKDTRIYANIGYNQKNLRQGITKGIRFGISNEYDYFSLNGGISFAKEWNEGNSELSLQGQAFFDTWQVIFPAELQRTATVPTDQRRSYNLSATYSQVLNKRMQIAISGEVIFMEGLLSTPFHRVYFADQEQAKIERLPETRLKFPVSVRFNYFAHENFIIRTYYRYYSDDFGVQGHTASIEIPVKIGKSFSVSPFFRYHSQKGSDYFAHFNTHVSTEEFYTSDYDLSTLKSQKFGLAIGYNPTFGILNGHFLKKTINFKSVEMRLAQYSRDTGLKSYLGSLNFSFQF